uniref:Minor structural protein n=1 Tax=Siphoviridae sp. ctsxw88 TaxID=2825701 RepID=A0A8S5PIL8_9CAUD|nr:MAG TPA: minor structural protein [Siphoviridae sp. ctsxw88]
MVNIYEILSKQGITVPEASKTDFEKEFFDNYKTTSEVENLKAKLGNATTSIANWEKKYKDDLALRDNDLASLKDQLQKANENDKSEVVKDLQAQLDTLTNNYATEKADYEKKLAKQQYEFLVKEQVNGLKFTSASAKKAFTNDVLTKELPVEDGKLLGFADYLANYKEQDSGAFVNEELKKEPEPKPQFVSKSQKIDTHDTHIEKPRPRIL